jgi:hypothetical protein
MKKENKFIIVLILILIFLILGATYAYFILLISNPEDSTELYTGTLVAEYSQGSIIDEQSFYPRTEATPDDLKYAYSNDFTITNTGTLDGLMQLTLEISKNTFTSNAIKYSLYNSLGIKITSGDIPNSDNVILIDNVLIKSQESANYSLIIWLQENETQQNTDEGQRLTAAITANLVQYIQ